MKNGKKIGVWFRNDLRLHDHQPILEALNRAEFVVPIFCFDTRNFTETSYGTAKTGFFRARFLLESVKALRLKLQSKGADLIILIGKPEEEIVSLAGTLGLHQIVAYKEVAAEEVRISDLVEEKLWKLKISMDLFLGNTLFNKEDLPFPIKDVPDTFSIFKKRVERDSHVRSCLTEPEIIPYPENIMANEIPTLQDLGINDQIIDCRGVLDFKGGEAAGLGRLHEYIWEKELIKNYKNTRNGMLGADYSSKLSAWLSLGCLSPRKVYEQIKAFESDRVSNGSTQGLFYELLWRDYFRFVFKKYGSRLFNYEGLKTEGPEYREHTESDFFLRWKTGQTGIPFIDANMRELSATGFMSNRGRQVVASFLVYDCKVRWTFGAAWFEEKLIDYNAATTWGNWAFIAGVGNDPKEVHSLNVIKQAFDYDAKGEYVKYWIPELQNLPTYLIHQPHLMTDDQQKLYGLQIGNNYPVPLVEFKKFEKQY